MITVYPDYYPLFHCIAGECRHSCCIGWEIDIDPRTLRKYLLLPGTLGDCIRTNIASDEEGAHFLLSEDERCPFLDEKGLCRLIKEKGEGFLCRICSDHPRFYHFRSDGIEMGLGLCCEAACELILNQKQPSGLVIQDDGRRRTPARKWEQQYISLLSELMAAAQDRTQKIAQRLEHILEFVGMGNADLSPSLWFDSYVRLEHMENNWENLLLNAEPDDHAEEIMPEILEQLLVYFLYRHLFTGCQQRLAPFYVGFAVLSVRMIMAIACNRQELICEIARMYSAEIEYSDENIKRLIVRLQEEVCRR